MLERINRIFRDIYRYRHPRHRFQHAATGTVAEGSGSGVWYQAATGLVATSVPVGSGSARCRNARAEWGRSDPISRTRLCDQTGTDFCRRISTVSGLVVASTPSNRGEYDSRRPGLMGIPRRPLAQRESLESCQELDGSWSLADPRRREKRSGCGRTSRPSAA